MSTTPDPETPVTATVPAAAGAEPAGGGALPAVLAGAGVLAVAVLLLFGGGEDKDKTSDAAAAKAKKTARSEDGGGGKGVGSREVDEATPGTPPRPRVNPAVNRAPEFGSMSSTPPDKEPASFPNKDAEIAWVEGQLTEAKRIVALREKAIERMPKIAESIKKGPNPEDGLASLEKRTGVLHDHIAKGKAKIGELEGRLEGLKSQ